MKFTKSMYNYLCLKTFSFFDHAKLCSGVKLVIESVTTPVLVPEICRFEKIAER